ncbi:NBR1-Ig-like domain-containing protein [Nonomuraea sp. NPDC050790]|uniref:NBR1-Ig-like domain-containing protein n=1 Tax=Nonomuraea sp. NPDC050790 TaxID=3364371 RepID=UPI00378D1313
MDDRRARAEAIEDFAAALRELRDSVGNPPFREMSGRSGAISHTTLHEAVKGNRLPSWETTVEFVKACGADPAAYRERWDAANLAVKSVGGTAELPVVVADDVRPADVRPADVRAAWAAQDVRPSPRARWLHPAVVAGATAVVLGAVVLVVVVFNRESTPEGPLTPVPDPSIALSSAGCPVRSGNPPPAPPLYKGDAAVFVADVTLPDCMHVGPEETLAKVWRLKNAGSVVWKGYSLRRLDPAQQADHCRTVSSVPIKDTRPGQMVDIGTDVTTPSKPGLCYARFKMVDKSGKVVFPGSRPVTFQIIVNRR